MHLTPREQDKLLVFMAAELARRRDRLALLPQRVREPKGDLDNEF